VANDVKFLTYLLPGLLPITLPFLKKSLKSFAVEVVRIGEFFANSFIKEDAQQGGDKDIDKGISKRNHKELRTMVVEAAWQRIPLHRSDTTEAQ
jgi:hypothetical protein